MTLLESFAQIPLMLYAALLLLPGVLYGYLRSSKSKKTIAAVTANPADQLKEKRINLKREVYSVFFLGSCLGLGMCAAVSFAWLIGDYKNNTGLFAASGAAATFPPGPDFELPPFMPSPNSTVK